MLWDLGFYNGFHSVVCKLVTCLKESLILSSHFIYAGCSFFEFACSSYTSSMPVLLMKFSNIDLLYDDLFVHKV